MFGGGSSCGSPRERLERISAAKANPGPVNYRFARPLQLGRQDLPRGSRAGSSDPYHQPPWIQMQATHVRRRR